MIKNTRLQCMYLGIALASSFCVVNNFHVLMCANAVGVMCLVDFFFVRKKDMVLHHVLVLTQLHYINGHADFEHKEKFVATILSTEVSTIFLISKHFLENTNLVVINNLAFVTTFVYFRIYNYAHQILFNDEVHRSCLKISNNRFEYGQCYVGLYGLFLLNGYWCSLIIKAVWQQFIRSKQGKRCKTEL